MTSKVPRTKQEEMDRFIPSYKETLGIRGIPINVPENNPVQNENLKQIFL